MTLRRSSRGRWVGGQAGVLLLVACARSSGSDDEGQRRIDRETALARQAIEITAQRYMMHFNAGNADSVAVIYAERGRILWPNGPTAVGRDSIAARLRTIGALTPVLSLRTEEVAASGALAVERGRYTMTWTPPGGSQVADSGKYLMRWHRTGAEWMIVDNIWNSDLPTPP
jgi:ketosteroid isomerase-like protein